MVAEDHRVEGGLGDGVLAALAETGPLSGRVVKLGVREMPGSGTPDELRAWAGIDAASIAAQVRDALREPYRFAARAPEPTALGTPPKE